jgi:hypothetical protein
MMWYGKTPMYITHTQYSSFSLHHNIHQNKPKMLRFSWLIIPYGMSTLNEYDICYKVC